MKNIEGLFLKVASAHAIIYENMTFDIFSRLLTCSDYSYHLKMANLILEMIDAII